MSKYWIHNRRFDSIWILFPPIAVWLIVVLFHKQLEAIQDDYSFWTWLILIVFIDVAHVYASIFRSYLVKEKWKTHRRLFIALPLFCFAVSSVLYSFGSSVFWSVLAYIAVFHFIRQQYGFMRLYGRKENLLRWERVFDGVAIYNATLYPMIYWFLNPNRNFTWFTENDFLSISSPFLSTILFWIYCAIIVAYVLYLLLFRRKKKEINYPKLIVIAGTYLSWYFGIVYFNNELIFTLLNVVSHGIPYMALVFVTEFKQQTHNFVLIGIIKQSITVLAFIGILLGLAVFEEFTWENFVWKEQISWVDIQLNEIWVVPILALPQFVHYVLDAFIWRKGY